MSGIGIVGSKLRIGCRLITDSWYEPCSMGGSSERVGLFIMGAVFLELEMRGELLLFIWWSEFGSSSPTEFEIFFSVFGLLDVFRRFWMDLEVFVFFDMGDPRAL